jgi:hypothetical protein
MRYVYYVKTENNDYAYFNNLFTAKLVANNMFKKGFKDIVIEVFTSNGRDHDIGGSLVRQISFNGKQFRTI